jgi:glycerol-3-phosphate dehydrogenase (NAD(P)+)
LWSHERPGRRASAARRYLPDAQFPASLHAEPVLAAAIAGCTDVLIAVPSQGFRAMLEQLRPLLRPGMRLAWATKGFEQETGKLPHQVVREVLGEKWPIAVLSGPTFAKEVGAGLPTAMTVASPDEHFASAIARRISGANFRAYTSTDIIGRGRRRGEKRARDRRGIATAWIRGQHAHRADRARSC